jgi:hypothetical protein
VKQKYIKYDIVLNKYQNGGTMVDVNKSSLGDILKKALDPKAEEAKTAGAAPTQKYNPTSGTVSSGTGSAASVKAAEDSLKTVQASRLGADTKKQEEVLHTKTHQDLINAAYKAAEKLGIAPWVLLRAAEWGTFTDDRGKKYTGPAIDDIKGLDDAQKKALKEVLGL